MVFRADRTQTVLHDLRRHLSRLVRSCVTCAESHDLDHLPDSAGRRRRRFAAQRTSHPRGHASNLAGAAWLSRSTAWPWCWLRPSVLRSADGSPTILNWRWIFFINIPVGIVSPAAHQFADQRSPVHEAKKNKTFRVDFIGLGLPAPGLGTLQAVLDKGQRDDWFGSAFHRDHDGDLRGFLDRRLLRFHENPIIDLHLFKDRSSAVGNLMMFISVSRCSPAPCSFPTSSRNYWATPRSRPAWR